MTRPDLQGSPTKLRNLGTLIMKKEHLTGKAQVKGTMIQAHLEWLRKQGIDPTTALRDHLPSDLVKLVSHRILATTWVSLSALVAVDRAIAAATKRPSEEVFRSLGRFSATSNLAGVYAGFVSDEPHRFFEKQARLHDRFQDFGESIYKIAGPREGLMKLSNYTEFSPVFCLSAVGYYQGALETMKAPGHIRVDETGCTCSGDEACTFELKW